MDKSDFNKYVGAYLVDQTKFADSKTAVAIGFDGVILKYGLDAYVPNTIFITDKLDFWGCIILSLGMLFLISVVFPNKLSAKKGIIFWGNIARYKKVEDYLLELDQTTDLDKVMAEQNYYIARVANSKFSRFRYGFLISLIGVILILIKLVSKYTM